MIIKKPYAFMIKHFRMIHLFLSIFLIFLQNLEKIIQEGGENNGRGTDKA